MYARLQKRVHAGHRSRPRAAAGRRRSGRSGGSAPSHVQRRARARRARRQDAVEHVDAGADHAQDPLGSPIPMKYRGLSAASSGAAQWSPRTSPRGSRRPRGRPARSRRSRARDLLDRPARSSGSAAPARSRRRAGRARSASRCRAPTAVVRRTASSSSWRGTPAGGQMSKAIATSEPRLRWIARRSRREARGGAVVDRAERDAVVVDPMSVSRRRRPGSRPSRSGSARPSPRRRAARRARRSARRPGGSAGGTCCRARSVPRARAPRPGPRP